MPQSEIIGPNYEVEQALLKGFGIKTLGERLEYVPVGIFVASSDPATYIFRFQFRPTIDCKYTEKRFIGRKLTTGSRICRHGYRKMHIALEQAGATKIDMASGSGYSHSSILQTPCDCEDDKWDKGLWDNAPITPPAPDPVTPPEYEGNLDTIIVGYRSYGFNPPDYLVGGHGVIWTSDRLIAECHSIGGSHVSRIKPISPESSTRPKWLFPVNELDDAHMDKRQLGFDLTDPVDVCRYHLMWGGNSSGKCGIYATRYIKTQPYSVDEGSSWVSVATRLFGIVQEGPIGFRASGAKMIHAWMVFNEQDITPMHQAMGKMLSDIYGFPCEAMYRGDYASMAERENENIRAALEASGSPWVDDDWN